MLWRHVFSRGHRTIIAELTPVEVAYSRLIHTWCPRQDSNLRSRLRRPVKPRSCPSPVSSRSVLPAQRVMCCCGVVWFIARTLARLMLFAGRGLCHPATQMQRSLRRTSKIGGLPMTARTVPCRSSRLRERAHGGLQDVCEEPADHPRRCERPMVVRGATVESTPLTGSSSTS